MTENYLAVLEESLQKKTAILDEIQEYNRRQQEIFETGSPSMDDFDRSIEEKGKLIDRLAGLDGGFETLYAKIAQELQGDREKYARQIRSLQQLITQVTEKSVSVQAQEARNKKLIERYFAQERETIGQGRRASKAAYDYYKNMKNVNVVMPQLMDKKK